LFETENTILSTLWTNIKDDANGNPVHSYFWIAGTDQGWKLRDGSYVGYDDQQHFVGGSTAGANMGATTAHDYVRYSLDSNEWDFVTSAESYGFVCEISLDSKLFTSGKWDKQHLYFFVFCFFSMSQTLTSFFVFSMLHKFEFNLGEWRVVSYGMANTDY
jgi:hypothetical protein